VTNGGKDSRMIIIDGLQADECDREVFVEWQKGGVSCVHVSCMNYTFDNTRDALSALSRWRRAFRDNHDIIQPVTNAAGIRTAMSEQRTAVLLGFQNTLPLEDDLALVEIFYDLGIRCIQLTYNHQGLAGAGCLEPVDPGLSLYGKKIVAEMNRLRMLIDVSHCGVKTTMDTIENSDSPIAVTHSNSLSFSSNVELKHRLKSDQAMKALAEKGGMFGMALFPAMLPGGVNCTLSNFCDLVEHSVELVGAERLGLGTDFVWRRPLSYIKQVRTGRGTFETAPVVPPKWPEWMKTPADFPRIAGELSKRGWSDARVEGFMGKNWLDFYAKVIG
jgi:membrane dipeptidase